MFSNMKKISIILLIFTFFSCEKDKYFENLNTMDSQLEGSWWDTNTIYTFSDGGNDTLYFGQKHLRSGVGQDSIKTDSIFGWFLIDNERKNITFNVEGWITKYDSITIIQKLNSTTWNYSISDTILNYESSTTLGTLTRYKY